MPVTNTTSEREYPLPHPENNVDFDVLRIISALSAIDSDIAAALIAIAGKASSTHGHVINDITGLQGALDGKMSATASRYLAGLADVDVEEAASDQFLRWNGGKWVPVDLDAGMIASGRMVPARLPEYLSQQALAAKLGSDEVQASIAAGVLPTVATGGLGAIGTYAMCSFSLQSSIFNMTPGATIAGSNLVYAQSSDDIGNYSTSPTGTWRCMGDFRSYFTSNGSTYVAANLFLRIA